MFLLSTIASFCVSWSKHVLDLVSLSKRQCLSEQYGNSHEFALAPMAIRPQEPSATAAEPAVKKYGGCVLEVNAAN